MAFPEGVIHCCEVISSSYHLDDGPSVRASIGATYAGKELPTILVNLGANVLTCLNTGTHVTEGQRQGVPGIRDEAIRGGR
jgi:hypothetical protein